MPPARARRSVLYYPTFAALLVMIYFGFYSRIEVRGISGGTISVAVAVLLSGTLVARAAIKYIDHPIRWSVAATPAIVFFLSSVVLINISALANGTSLAAANRMSIELTAVAAMFLASYVAVRSRVLDARALVIAIVLAATYSGTLTLSSLVDQSELRRLAVDGGRNYIGSAFVAAALAALYLARTTRTRARTFAFVVAAIICLIAVFLIGSRQALAAVALCGVVLTFSLFKGARAVLAILALLFAAFIFIVFMSTRIDLGALLDRFSLNMLLNVMEQRYDIYKEALGHLQAADILFGRPDYYELWSDEIHPHNLFISSLRHLGAVPTLMLGWAIAATLYGGWAASVSRYSAAPRLAAATTIMFASALIYSQVSGNLTRMFHLYVLWGLAAAVIDQQRIARREARFDYRRAVTA